MAFAVGASRAVERFFSFLAQASCRATRDSIQCRGIARLTRKTHVEFCRNRTPTSPSCLGFGPCASLPMIGDPLHPWITKDNRCSLASRGSSTTR